MQQPIPLTRDLVLIGGGHAHALILRRWGMNPQAGVRLTLINPGPLAAYTGMLPGLVAGHYAREDVMIDLVRLCRFAGARLIMEAATGIDRDARTIHLTNRPPLRYDVASLDVGVGAAPDLPHVTPARPLGPFAAAWDAFLARNIQNPRIVVLGGGIAGVELALAVRHRTDARVTVVDKALVLASLGARARQTVLRHARVITFIEDDTATDVFPAEVRLASGRVLPADFTIAVAGAAPHPWLSTLGLTMHDGSISVGPTLQSSDPLIFAAGDCAHLTHAPRAKAGVFAVRAAPILHDNLRAALAGQSLRHFHPQRDYLRIISLGGKLAAAEKSGLVASGAWPWRLKDRIDRAFMKKLSAFPPMPRPTLPRDVAMGVAQVMGDKPMCGGCGAKVGALTLTAALGNLSPPERPDVLTGAGDDAAMLSIGGRTQVITTDHLRTFTGDPYVMARIAARHALGDIWAMGAQPQAALAQITLPALGPELQSDMLAEILDAAGAVFNEAGADVVGGHTTVGTELTIGFTITGLTDHPIRKGGATPGDVLMLTGPIGSGVIMAAEMATAHIPGVMLGEAVQTALAGMQRSLAPAASILAPVATAMTDITGFGLAGHLSEMLKASGCGATLFLANIPLLPGAEALAAAGIASTLAPANRAAVAWQTDVQESPRAALLYDPQTAGPLLAAVPADRADAVLAALGDAVVIGKVVAGEVRVRVV
jgi:selenide, water dikinase